jgi:adenosylcobinamide kinase/adenosylcobinamide-phosphate guanylyltransferase
LLFRHWAHRDEPLDVYAPQAVIEQLHHWAAPQDPVHFHAITVGDQFDTRGYRVTAHAANHGDETIGEALLFDITSASGGRLFYATDTGPLSDPTLAALQSAQFDVVLLEETFGDHMTHDGDHLDLKTFPEQLRRLRRVDAVTDSTDVVAVHLSHHNPPTHLLQRRLEAWGARVVPDGTTIATGQDASAQPAASRLPRRTLVVGGARSGKSQHAESLVCAEGSVTYVATAERRPDDPDWTARVAAHRQRRPSHWHTVETNDVASILTDAKPGDVLLIDCLTLWLTQTMDDTDAWSGDLSGVHKQIEQLLDAWVRTQAFVVAVSNEVGQGVVPATASGRLFRDAQGRLNAKVAAASEVVTLMVAGRPVTL